MPVHSVVRNRLKVLRAERDLSQEDLARRAGIHVDRYWRIEREVIYPTTEERRIIIGVLAETAREHFERMASKLPRVTIASTGLQVDDSSNKPGRRWKRERGARARGNERELAAAS